MKNYILGILALVALVACDVHNIKDSDNHTKWIITGGNKYSGYTISEVNGIRLPATFQLKTDEDFNLGDELIVVKKEK
jgi:hypothetical protein